MICPEEAPHPKCCTERPSTFGDPTGRGRRNHSPGARMGVELDRRLEEGTAPSLNQRSSSWRRTTLDSPSLLRGSCQSGRTRLHYPVKPSWAMNPSMSKYSWTSVTFPPWIRYTVADDILTRLFVAGISLPSGPGNGPVWVPLTVY